MIRNIVEFFKVMIVSLIIVLPIRYFIIQPFYVKGASMEPTFHDHEYLIVDEISYRLNEPQRGDVVVFRYPLNPKEYFIKRIIALPGEVVEIREGYVYISNKDSDDSFVLNEKFYLDPGVETSGYNEEVVDLRPGEYFVLGDNRAASMDSRNFGPVHKSFIVGRVMLRAWPFKDFAWFKKVSPYNN